MKKLLCIILLFLLLTANVGQAQFNDTEPMFGQLLNFGHWSTDGLVFYWRGIRDKNVIDESLYRNHGTITGATWAGDRLSFDGSNDYVEVPELGSALDGKFLTVIAKVRGVSLGNLYPRIIDRVYNGQFSFYVSLNAGTEITYALATAGNSTDKGSRGVFVEFFEDVWTIIALTWDGVTVRMYQDGVETYAVVGGVDGILSGPLVPSSAIMTIGDRTDGTNRKWSGDISHVSIYNRALSASEISEITLNLDLPMQQEPIWLMYSPGEPPSGIVPIIQAHTRRRRAG